MTSRKLLTGAGVTLAALVLTGVVRVLARIGAGRWFGNDALALVTLAISVAAIATIVGAGGLAPGITKFIAQLRGEERLDLARELGSFAARVTVGMSAVGALAGSLYLWSSHDNASRAAVASVAALVFVFGLYQAGKSILYGEGEIRPYAARELVGGALFVIGMVIAWRTRQAWWVILALVLAYSPVASAAARRAFLATGSLQRLPLRQLAGYGILGAIGSLAGVGFSYSTPIAANLVDAVTGAALIGGVLTILEPFNLLPRAVSLVLLPSFSETNAREGATRSGSSLALTTRYIAAASAPALLLIALERDRVLGFVFPDLGGDATLAWFALAFFLRIVGTPSVTSLAALDFKRASIAMWSSLVGFSIAITVWFVAGPIVGISAIGIGYAGGTVVQVVPPLVVATRRYRVEWGRFWLRLGASLSTAAAATRLTPGFTVDAVVFGALVALFWPEISGVVRSIGARVGVRRG